MSATEVTFAQYDAYCEATGAPKPADNGWGRGTLPVMHVSYDDALGFCRWLGKETGTAIRLPTEAEWEFAAQGGSRSRGYVHSGGDDPDEVSWNERNSRGRTHPVGTKKSNELGLFDMSGNLWEWCADPRETSPRGARVSCATCAGDGTRPALHGNSYDNPGSRLGFRQCVRLDRDSRHTNIGFRVARS
jgi:formylglycine-generating enzyme required for sulfatase activity